MPPTRLPRPLAVTLAATALALAACGGSEAGADPGAAGGDGLDVVVSFYPLEWATTRIAGDRATVETLTAPGAEPHDVELTPQAVADVQGADLVVYSAGLQAAVEVAVDTEAADHALDVNDAADLEETGAAGEHGDNGGLDPHFWLDPARMGTVSSAIAERLAEVDPDHAQDYRANAEALVEELTALKADFDTGLASCAQEDMVTSHDAFGYLAHDYGFQQVGITGIAPDAEPSPARLAEVTRIVEESGVDTIYSEVLLGTDIAGTVASETGAQVLVLDPVEGLTDASAGDDYIEIMRANLDALREGQHCS